MLVNRDPYNFNSGLLIIFPFKLAIVFHPPPKKQKTTTRVNMIRPSYKSLDFSIGPVPMSWPRLVRLAGPDENTSTGSTA